MAAGEIVRGRVGDADVQMRSETIDHCSDPEPSPSRTRRQRRQHMWTHTHARAHQDEWLELNKCHPRVRWRGRAGPAVCSLACAAVRNRCCSPEPRSRPLQTSGCHGHPPGIDGHTPGTPALASKHTEHKMVH